MIQWKRNPDGGFGPVEVYLDKKKIGEIRSVEFSGSPDGLGWQYFPKGQKKGGEIFVTLRLCQQDVAGDDYAAAQYI